MAEQMTLGGMIDALAKIRLHGGGSKPIIIDGRGRQHPLEFRSWRGVYAQLALGYCSAGCTTSVETLLKEARTAEGKDFRGYKGGSYRMTRETPLWLDNWGDSHDWPIVGIEERDRDVLLRFEDDEEGA